MLSSFKIGDRRIGKSAVFVIAEIGQNHNCKMSDARKLIDVAVDAGADAVKFQLLRNVDFNVPSLHFFNAVFKYCKEREIIAFASTNNLKDIDVLEEFDVQLHKIASPQTANNGYHIQKIAKLDKPVIMSTGYCDEVMVDKVISLVARHNRKLAVLHCVSEYPARPSVMNLQYIKVLQEYYEIPVGLSDHTLGWHISLAAVAMGADIIEKHITLDKNQEGPDHPFALEPYEFKRMVKEIREIEDAFGNGCKEITEREQEILESIYEKT